jgi:hypothetical protein
MPWFSPHAANMSRMNKRECHVTDTRDCHYSEKGHTPAYANGRAGQRVSIAQGRDGATLNESETDRLIPAV